MINLSRNFLRAFLRRAFSADGSLSRGGRSRLSRRRSPKKRRIAFAWEEGGAFMIFAGSGRNAGFRVPCATEGGGDFVYRFVGAEGRCVLRFFGPEEQRGGGRTSDFVVADVEGRPSPASCRSATSLVAASRGAAASAKCAACRRRAGRRAERSALCARAFRRAPAACNLFRRSAFLRCSGGATARLPVPLTGRTLAFTPERNEVFRRPHGYFFLISRSGAVPRPA